MNDMWSRLGRVYEWHAQAVVTGEYKNAPLADIACVANFARERLRDIEDMSDQERRLQVIRNPIGWEGIHDKESPKMPPDASDQPIIRRPLYLVEHNEYFEESWHVLAAFTDKELAFQFIDKTSDEWAKTFDTSGGDFDDWHSFTVQETVLHELSGNAG